MVDSRLARSRRWCANNAVMALMLVMMRSAAGDFRGAAAAVEQQIALLTPAGLTSNTNALGIPLAGTLGHRGD